jgi:hypothetical protein
MAIVGQRRIPDRKRMCSVVHSAAPSFFAVYRDKEKESIIPLDHPVYPEDLEW